MALENYLEMRERVSDPRFRLQQALALELEKRFPTRFIPRYSMVMFHHEISYRIAEMRGGCRPGCWRSSPPAPRRSRISTMPAPRATSNRGSRRCAICPA